MPRLLDQKIENILGIILGLVGVAVLFFRLVPSFEQHQTAITPNIESPIIETGASLTSIDLINQPYEISSDPFSESNFKKAPKIVLKGPFSHIQLDITGTVKGSGKRFLILNFNGQGGIIRAPRDAINSIDVDKADSLGGVFTNEKPISVSLDLQNDYLGTIGSEYKQTGIGFRSFSFIAEDQSQTVTQLLVVPFVENGQYGGASIDSLIVRYSCKQDDASCFIVPCNKASYSECYKENSNDSDYRKWMKKNYPNVPL